MFRTVVGACVGGFGMVSSFYVDRGVLFTFCT